MENVSSRTVITLSIELPHLCALTNKVSLDMVCFLSVLCVTSHPHGPAIHRQWRSWRRCWSSRTQIQRSIRGPDLYSMSPHSIRVWMTTNSCSPVQPGTRHLLSSGPSPLHWRE